MPIVERKIEINAPVKKVWDVLLDPKLLSKWNITVKDINEIGPNKRSVKATVGDYSYILTERKENKKLSFKTLDRTDFGDFGYKLKRKGDKTEVSSWIDYEIVKHEELLGRSSRYLLEGLKKFVEFIEEGGDPDSYEKGKVLLAP